MPTVAVIYFSAQGHTHQIAEAVAEGAKGVAGTTVEVIRIIGEDIVQGRWKNPSVLAKLSAVDAIVFGTPTYMAGYSAQFKTFIDAASEVWAKLGWKDKLAAGFTHSGGLSGDKLNTLQGLWLNAMQHGMIWVGLGELVEGTAVDKVNRLSCYSGVMAQTDWGQEKVNEGDRKSAVILGKRVAEAAARWSKGKL
ncbi:MAG TPA: flavodoxin family protein [Gemmata sp.]|jgi:NAD(P)H dehydrogenase (quinone)|nr:flavodoxin family protein [Gemmata sp.]